MKKLNKILFVVIAGLFTAGIASASLGEYWSTVSHIIPRTDVAVDIGSATKKVREIWTNKFYGDYWISSTGNSMSVQPTGDTDDFFSFKTPADRPTIKREGGKYIYIQSSNVNDVGISFRKDADHSGTVNYYKDTNEFGLTSKDPLVFKVCADYDDYVKICAASNVPEMSTVGAADFKINAGGANNLLLNHAGGNVGIGDATPAALLTVGDGDVFQVSSTGVVTFTGTGDIDLPANSVDEADLKAVNAPTDEYVLTYEATTGDFEWQTCGGSLAINDITDITIDTPADNEVLAYNNGTSTWLNQTPAEAGLQPLEATLTDIADGTIAENLVNTANPWADNEVSDTLTCSDLVSAVAVVDISTETNLTAGRSLTMSADSVVADTELYTDTKCIYFEDPTATDDFNSIWTANGFAATITKIWCESDQTVNMDLAVDDGSVADVNGTDLVCDSTPAEDESMGGDATLADGDRLDLLVTSVSGTPTWVSICWTYTKDD